MTTKEITIDDFTIVKIEKNSFYVLSPTTDERLATDEICAIAEAFNKIIEERSLNSEVIVLPKKMNLLTADQARIVLEEITE